MRTKRQPTSTSEPSDALELAHRFLDKKFRASNGLHETVWTLRWWRGDFYQWRENRYVVLDRADLRQRLYQFLTPKASAPSVSNLIDAIQAATFLPSDVEPPCWISRDRLIDPNSVTVETAREGASAQDLVAVEDGLYDLIADRMLPPDPELFTFRALPFNWHGNPASPKRWKKFLSDLWPDDREAVQALQEIFGYLISGETRTQKVFLLVGPKRSGKGTIARVLTALLGDDSVAGPTLSSLSTNFGLQPLIGKSLAIISDARIGRRSDHNVIVERLLSISGEDRLTIDRKFREPWTGKLATRFLVCTNELPQVMDASGALASRFVVLTLRKSFYGREDILLTEKLLEELAGIFDWALMGLDRLRERGHFITPASAREDLELLEALGSPISTFLSEKCEVGPGNRVACAEFYGAWRRWCDRNGHTAGTKQNLGKELRAALPEVRVRQRNDGRFYDGVRLANAGPRADREIE